MPATPLSIPKGFRRLNSFALDPSCIFASKSALDQYASTNPTAYPGQTCAVVLGESAELYVLNAQKLPVIATGSGGSQLAEYLEARQIVLTGEQAEESTLTLREPLTDPLYHRPTQSSLPGQRGWLSGVSNVTITSEVEGAQITTPLTAGQDFVFFPDRQCFYFTNPETEGAISIVGSASRNFIDFGVSMTKQVAASSSVQTTIPIDSPDFEILTCSVVSPDKGTEEIPDFYFDKTTATILFKSNITSSAVVAYFATSLGEVKMRGMSLTAGNELEISKDIWPSIDGVSVDGVALASADYSFANNQILLATPVTNSLVTIFGPQTEYSAKLTGATVNLPSTLLRATRVECSPKTTINGQEWNPAGLYYPFYILEKIEGSPSDILHLGGSWPSGQADGTFTITAAFRPTPEIEDTYTYTFNYWPGNAIELPAKLDNVHTMQAANTTGLVVFDPDTQTLLCSKERVGTLQYTATHRAYEGLALGGETLEIVEEIPGIYATTCGTGHYISTLRTFSPPLDWYEWWVAEWGRKLVQIVDSQNIIIYQDESPNAFAKSRPGYTALELKPLTLKLPLAALYPTSRRNDDTFFQEAFQPDFLGTTFSSSTFPELDDTQRYAADSLASGKTITLSSNTSAPVRGVQGASFAGPKPTFYAGQTVPYIALATYKWFVVKCTATGGNPALTSGNRYLLCVNNVHLDSKAIMVNITNEGFNVAADLYEIRRAN